MRKPNPKSRVAGDRPDLRRAGVNQQEVRSGCDRHGDDEVAALKDRWRQAGKNVADKGLAKTVCKVPNQCCCQVKS